MGSSCCGCCGNGAQTLLFLDDFEQVTGVDVSEDFLKEFRREISRRGLDGRVKGLATDGGPIPLPVYANLSQSLKNGIV